MPADALLTLAGTSNPLAPITKTATFNGAATILAGGTPRRGLSARVVYTAASNASGANAVTFSVDVSYDAGVTWYSDFNEASQVVNLTTTVKTGEFFIPFSVSPTSVANGVQIRLTATFSGAGATPTITYFSDIVSGRP